MKCRSKLRTEVATLKARIVVLEKRIEDTPAQDFMPMSDDLYRTIADASAEILAWNVGLREGI